MQDVFSDIVGIVIAGGIIYAAKEIRRTADAIRDLDFRVSGLERWLHREGIRPDTGRPDDADAAEERGSGGPG